ncbi:SCO family protein [Hufsiella ginkgonis]|uniref:SCO family protein n=1 Tax=Hufsiella ginkgonis TaxID=2695274 RepID=A0A7K1Y0W3_9SPHI|nr:SCO family protein [Hufsiella ginkgonis]MXV16316.1 SCO family protein [Hufsiella ginkgonis]
MAQRSVLYLLLLIITVSCTKQERKLPILGNREPVEKVVDGKTVIDTIYQAVPAFSFLNQDSVRVTEQAFNGKIYVADFFFTRCPSICPVMHRNMLKVYEKYKGNASVKLLSHTIDAIHDQPSVLKTYATKLGITGDQWEFVHGSHDSVYTIAEKSYLVAVGKEASAPGGFIHQGWFVLVDKQKRLRGAYDGTDTKQVAQLIEDMGVLLNEEDGK